METPFISPLDMAMIEEKREENPVLEEENEVKMSQVRESCLSLYISGMST
jgi:hypothetical protein